MLRSYRWFLLGLGLMATLLLAACGSQPAQVPTLAPEVLITSSPQIQPPTPHPTATQAGPQTATPTPMGQGGQMPAGPQEDAWQRIQQRGVMIVGTSADYPPFEYYNEAFQLDGFDIALIREIGKRLGVSVEILDIAFDGLGDALALGQIDAAIAAISITPEREAVLDFSSIYFISQDAIVAMPDANLPPITQVQDLAKLRVGVQRGSVFQDWLEDKLVKTGLMPETQLFLYANIADAAPDLQGGRVDVLVMDEPVAEQAVRERHVAMVASGLHRELYGIALSKGQEALRTQINQALRDLLRDRVIDQLAQEYLHIAPEAILPLPTPTPAPPQPLPTPTPQGCYDGLSYVQDLNYDDQNMTNPPLLQPGEGFRKGWRVRNTGTCPWDSGYMLDFVYGNVTGARMGGLPVAVQGEVMPGQTYDIYVDLVAPIQPGVYQGFWQMRNQKGRAFGQRVYVGIQVPAQPTPTPWPTATPSAEVNFWADNTSLRQGECTLLHWRTQNVQAVYYYQDGQNWPEHGVAGEGDAQECPGQTTHYYLRVVHRDGRAEERIIQVAVIPTANAPEIRYFVADPPYEISLGQCVTLRWDVGGLVSAVNVFSDDRLLWQGAPFRGELQDCPGSPGIFNYRLEAQGPGGISQANQRIAVREEAVPTPPPASQPIIYSFSVLPTNIAAGMCVTIGWQTGGSTSRVQIVRNGQVIWDGAPLVGTQQDCLNTAGMVTYELRASDYMGQTATATVRVQVD